MIHKRIMKNTLMLYSRQILILFVSLYTVRVVLNVLGAEDYGIFNVIGGVVALFSFLSGSMASATQRFFSFALGQNDFEKLKKIFAINLIIYITIVIIAFFLLETIGLWFIKSKLNVPPERFDSARFIFHFSVLTFMATIFTAPFMAIIIAHEDMHIYAIVSIVEVLLKLGIVFLLILLPWNKLELYGILLFSVSIINVSIYLNVCTRKYKECRFQKLYWDKKLFVEIINFTGWTLFGQLSTVFRNQAVTILLNQVFNPIVVAARAIATNVTNGINIFSTNFNVGLYPPIVKSYAANDKNNMFSLIFSGSKITFFLMWVFALPLFLEMETILRLWLKTPPSYAVLFTQLGLIEALINSVSLPLTTAARAPGKMRLYELTLGTIQIIIFVVAWVVLKNGGAAYFVYIVAIVANFVMFLLRLLIVQFLIDLTVVEFLRSVIFPILIVIMLSFTASLLIQYILPEGLVFSGLNIILSVVFSSTFMYFFGLDKVWRAKIRESVVNRIKNS